MNLADSERMAGALDAAGWGWTDDADAASVVIYNTCSIRDKAEQKVYSALGTPAKAKRAGRDVTLVLAGCVGAQEGAALLTRVPELDIVMGPHHAARVADLVDRAALGSQVVAVDEIDVEEDITVPRRGSNITAWVNASFGCDEACTYCVVPRTRGREQSRKPDDIKVREMCMCGGRGFWEGSK